MIEFLKGALLTMGILERKPSPEVMGLLKMTADAGGELYDPEVDIGVINEAKRLGLVEFVTSTRTGGAEYLCLTPGGRKTALAGKVHLKERVMPWHAPHARRTRS